MSENPIHPDALNPAESAHPVCAQAGTPLLSEQVFRAMFEQAAECLAVYDAEGHIIHANEAFARLMARLIPPEQYHTTLRERMARFEWQDAQGQPLAPEDWPVQRVLCGETLSGAEAMVTRGRTLDGTLIYLNSSGSPLRDASGQIIGAVFAHRDVTEYRQVRQELVARVRELEATYEAITDGLVVFDQAGRVVFANSAYRALVGFGSESQAQAFYAAHSSGRRLLLDARNAQGEVIADEDMAVLRLLRGEVLTSQHPLELLYRMLDGRELLLSTTGAAIRNEAGEIIGGVAVSRDITEQHQTQEEQAQLFNFIAHELNTPLTTMKGQTQLARRRLERGEQVSLEQLERIEQNMKRMERLVSDLLDSARLEQERVVLDLATLDLRGLCRQVAEEQALTSGRSVQLDLPGQPVLARGDALRLGQVLANLLSNALKYSPVETAVILRLRKEGGQARVEVQDSGPGMPPEVLPHLFERFYRAPGIRVLYGSGVGLGLGLYLCKSLVELHGGKIGASSVVGKGSTFWFTTPLSRKMAGG
jgi:signal transduction histidine kinase